MSNLLAMLKEHNAHMDAVTNDRIEKNKKFKERQEEAWKQIKANNEERDLAMAQFRLDVGRLSRGDISEEPDVFEQLVAATEVIKNPMRKVRVTGVRNTTCIRGLKRTVLICADGVDRIITYRGELSDAVPNGTVTLIDISEDME